MSRESQSAESESPSIELQLAFGDAEEPPHRPVADQRAVLASYFEGTGRVVVDASAGTGKTTTLVVTLAETIVRAATGQQNPLARMLVTTFGRDATAELKTRLKTLLRHHVDNGGALPPDVFRWIETDSNIQTLDSLFAELLREVAIEVGVPPDFTVDDRLELQAIRDDVIATLRRTHRSEFQALTAAYPAEEWREYPPESVEELLVSAHQNCREFGITTGEAADSLRESLVVGHGGEGDTWFGDRPSTDGPDAIPPETLDDVTAILQAVVSEDAELTYADDADAQQLLDHVRETYFATEAAIKSFATLLDAFETAYDSRTRRAGQFTFVDVAHLLESYLDDCEPTDPFRRTLGERFDHVFVDEFQDTSAVQCAVLRRLVDAETGASESKRTDETGANLFVIGDSKQAIYEWRSADPALFAEIIETTKTAAPKPARIPHLDVRDVRYHALTTVFRHHPDIAAAANHLFQRLLEDEGRGSIGEHAPSYVPVDPYGSPWEVDGDTDRNPGAGDSSHIHVLNVGAASGADLTRYISAADWASAEATRIGETIAAITDPVDEPPITIPTAEGDAETTHRQPTPGDMTLLFRSTRQMERYASVLREEYDIPAEAVATGDLFEQPEIELLVDLLSWIARPYAEGDLHRLLRSPLVALADESIRAIVDAESTIETFIEAWPESLPAADRQRLAGVVSLREDLHWEREQAKTGLIHRLLQHAGLDAVLLTDSDALRRYGNIWLLTELVDDWEVDELLSYREFISRLRQLRSRTDGTDPQFSTAEITDGEHGNAVTLTTVHQAKGREYPIVFLCDLPKQSTFPRLQSDRLVMSRQYGFGLRPRLGETPSPDGVDFPTPDSDLDRAVWFNDDFEAASYPEVTGPIWLSDDRTTTGEFRYPNPLNAHLEAREAEFWRLAYVAFTRAEAHVFLGLGQLDQSDDYYEDARWSTWLAAFNELLEPESGWDSISERGSGDRTITQALSWTLDTGESIDQTVPIGVDEIPPRTPTPTEPRDLSGYMDRLTGRGDAVDTAPYWPLTVSASSLSDFVDCPRAFQYEHIQGVDAAHARPLAPPSTASTTQSATQSTRPPGGLASNEWGEIVHRALELQLTDQTRGRQYAQRQPEPVRDSLKTILAAVTTAPFFEACLSGRAECVTEYELSTMVSTAGRDLRVTGTVDLLYRTADGWQLVDWKTGRRPAEGAAETHLQQLSVYAWLLDREFGITVDTALLGYIDPETEPVVTPVAVTTELDTEWVDRAVAAASEAAPISSDAGLETRPDPETCSGCPYGAHRNGPCMDDYHATDR